MSKIIYNIGVNVEIDTETKKTNVEVVYPSDQSLVALPHQVFGLASGIALIIRSVGDVSDELTLGLKDFELMESVMDYLQHEFVNNDSFKDRVVNKDLK